MLQGPIDISGKQFIPLCVPTNNGTAEWQDVRNTVSRAGAYWHEEPHNAWILRIDRDQTPVRRYVPFIFRTRKSGVIRPSLIPPSRWGANVRLVLGAEGWKRLAKEAYRRAGRRCQICGEHPAGQGALHTHEFWAWDIPAEGKHISIQRLIGLRCICAPCHDMIHIGRAEDEGRLDATKKRLCQVNGFGSAEVDRLCDLAWHEMAERDRMMLWHLDLTSLCDAFGIPPNEAFISLQDLMTMMENSGGR